MTLASLRGPLEIRVLYEPATGQVQVTAREASADQVLVALVKALFASLLREVRVERVASGP